MSGTVSVPTAIAGAAAAALAATMFAKWQTRNHICALEAALHKRRTKEFNIDPTTEGIQEEFWLDADALNAIAADMLLAMEAGLDQERGPLKMLPSFVTALPTGKETGEYLALDLGGSNFRTVKITLDGAGGYGIESHKFVIPEQIMTGTAHELFGFIADKVAEFVPGAAGANEATKLGFTFSFPVQQLSISSGTLIQWTKGFSAEGTVDNDVVALLQQSLNDRKIKIEVTALVNDTVGTLVARALQDTDCRVGLILGTGTNAAYVESMDHAPKLQRSGAGGAATEMIINTEWGGYMGTPLLVTKYDRMLDLESNNPGQQIFEKMISGMYLGELVRLVCVDLIKQQQLFDGVLSEIMATKHSFGTALMSQIEHDTTPLLTMTRSLLERELDVMGSDIEDRVMLKNIVVVVSTRAARLSAAGITGLLRKMQRQDVSVAVDGSVFKLYPFFQDRLSEALAEMGAVAEFRPKIVGAADGSGVGAAAVAAMADRM